MIPTPLSKTLASNLAAWPIAAAIGHYTEQR
jgi:hypothetical protein